MNMKSAVMLGGQAMAVFSTAKRLRQARAEGDKLKTLDSVVSVLSIATSVALIVRELREQRAELED